MIDRKGLHLESKLASALSGDFLPKIDANQRAHTIGGLLCATFEKGRSSMQLPASGDEFYTKYYRPSWSPHVEVAAGLHRVELRRGRDVAGSDWHIVFLNEISLRDPYDNQYEINVTRDQKNLRLTFNDALKSVPYSLELGSGLVETRQAVAETAELFFNTSREALAQHIALAQPAL